MTEQRKAPPKQPARRVALPLLIATFVSATALVVVAALSPRPADRPAAVEVDVPVSATARPQGNASLVVTLRWGDTRPDGVATDRRGAQRWDGQIALSCGTIEEVLPLGFDPTRGDSVAPVLPDQPVQWRSQVPAGRWAGLRLRVRTCAQPTPGEPGANQQLGNEGSAAAPWLRIETPFAHHELALRAGRNSFEAIPAESAESRSTAGPRGDVLEVHVAPRAATLHVSDAPVT